MLYATFNILQLWNKITSFYALRVEGSESDIVVKTGCRAAWPRLSLGCAGDCEVTVRVRVNFGVAVRVSFVVTQRRAKLSLVHLSFFTVPQAQIAGKPNAMHSELDN